MILLSAAITKGAALSPGQAHAYFDYASGASDPLAAAYLGSIKPESVPHFWEFVRDSTDETICTAMLHKLHTKWPHLGCSVRQWPRLAEELERDRLIPRIRTNQPEYRQEIHRSLWQVICDMHAAGESKGRIAEFLGRHGL